MLQIIVIAAGGATGALLRFWMSNGIHVLLGRAFPYGTLAVNVLGSFAMGLLYVYMLEKMEINAEWRAALTIGLLGAFTTFSTFSIETMNLIEAGDLGKAAINIGLSIGLCLFACWSGMLLGRQV
ncbi:MAG: CrcB protein [Planctomycetota bacterium]